MRSLQAVWALHIEDRNFKVFPSRVGKVNVLGLKEVGEALELSQGQWLLLRLGMG